MPATGVQHDPCRVDHDLPDPTVDRRSTYREAARLQGFDSDFTFPDTKNGSLDMRYKVVGNAVPPPLFAAVAKALPKSIW